jgi:hypothetical protein
MNDNDIIKAFDILDKFEFFGGQRAGRELWFGKPVDVQNKDIADFVRDVTFLKDFITQQKAEIERLQKHNTNMARKHHNDGVKELAKKLKEMLEWTTEPLDEYDIDSLVKLTEEHNAEEDSV